jgi:hypothetical protein
MFNRRSFFIAFILVLLLAFTTGIALADELPPPEEPTDPQDSTEPEERMPGQNPVAWFLSQYFAELYVPEEGESDPDPGMGYDEIMELHETYGFGNLARVFYLYSQFNSEEFVLPEGTELPEDFAGSLEDFLALREDYGWGVLYRELGLHPSQGSLGWAFKNAEEADKPGNGPPEWAHKPFASDESGDGDESGEPVLTGAGGQPDKPGKPDNPGKPDHAGPKDKKDK